MVFGFEKVIVAIGGVPVHVYANYRRVESGGRLVHIIGAGRNSVGLSFANGLGNEKTCVYGGTSYLGGTTGRGTLSHTFSYPITRRICTSLRETLGSNRRWGFGPFKFYRGNQGTFLQCKCIWKYFGGTRGLFNNGYGQYFAGGPGKGRLFYGRRWHSIGCVGWC